MHIVRNGTGRRARWCIVDPQYKWIEGTALGNDDYLTLHGGISLFTLCGEFLRNAGWRKRKPGWMNKKPTCLACIANGGEG